MTYIKFVETIICKKRIGEPIYVHQIADELSYEFNIGSEAALTAASVSIKRIISKHKIDNLRFYQKGIYYLCNKTPFGETPINLSKLIYDKYLSDNSGYESGPSFINKLGITTQMPNENYITTNRATNGKRKDKKLGVTIIPPKTTITIENKKYLQILDVLESLSTYPIDEEYIYSIIASTITDPSEYKTLLKIADKYYNKTTLINLAHVANSGEQRI